MSRFEITTLRGAAIHIASQPPTPIRFAAEELRRYLHRMTGVDLPVLCDGMPGDGHGIVLAANAAAARLTPPTAGSFAVVPESDRITLAGGSPRAGLDAAYALLYEMGCRWSLHGGDDDVVPQLTASALELPVVESTPRFGVRGYCSDIMTWHYTQPDLLNARLAGDRAFIDWMAKSGATSFFFIRHPFDTQLTIPELLPDFERRGIDVEYGGHVIPLLLPRERYREHPEYFPEGPEGARTDHGNLCTSNGAALDVVAASAVQYVRQYPEMRVLHIWGADLWHGGWCRCAACAAVSVQDQSLRVCNAVARGLADAGVGRPVCYLAYHDTLEPDLQMRPDDNVVIEFAPRERCYGHALNDASCATNRRYALALERYVELFDGRARLFEYYGDAILFFGCAVPLTEVIAADLEYYRGLGIDEILMLQFGTYSLWAYPCNFLAFAAAVGAPHAVRRSLPRAVREAYGQHFSPDALRVQAEFAELERLMRQVVTYGDIRRPPRSHDAAERVLASIGTVLPQLLDVARRMERLQDARLAAFTELLRYTYTVLDGVRAEIKAHLAGQPGEANERYEEALRIIETVDRRFKGVWGTVDLSVVHGYFAAALDAG